MKKIFALNILVFSLFPLFGQNKTTISGFVYDSLTKEILIGANIYETLSHRGTVSNEYGFYSLTLSDSVDLQVIVSFTGYKSQTHKISKTSNINFCLTEGVNIEEVTITANSYENIVRKNETGVVRLQMKDVKALPNLFGEVDIIKVLQLTPGVQSGGEAKSSLYVRGGSPDQNLFLLDDVPLYYVAHFGGFFSVFNADAIKDVKLIKSGFPSRYGSRLSSVLDIRMKDGNMQKLGLQGTLGLLSSKISIEAPIIKNKLSFIVSARKNLLPLFKIMDAGLSYNFYDINAKLNYRISTKNMLFVSFYMGDDIVAASSESEISDSKNSVKWGNTLGSFRWSHVFNDKLFSNLTISNTYYRCKNLFEYSLDSDTISKSVGNTLKTGIKDMSLKIDFTYIINPIYNLRIGLNSTYHTFIPNDEDYSQSGTNVTSINENYSSVFNAFENAAYVENELKMIKISANIGARLSTYHIGNQNYYSFEPRILLNYILRDDLSLKYSFSRMNQYVHLLTYSGVGTPADYWMPTTENVKPETSLQNTLGVAKTFKNGEYELSVETYYKTLDNLITFKPGESLIGNLDNWENVIEENGNGKNYGIEFFLQKLKGRTTGWVGITIAKAQREFENVNNGEVYPFKYDRLLDISIVANHKLNEKVILSATWTYGTGYPITLATERYNINGEDIFIYEERNSYRMRDYHRLDFAVNFPKKTKRGERTWTISVFNLYNRKNPYYYYYAYEEIPVSHGTSFSFEKGDLKLFQQSLFSIFPSFSYSFKF